VTQLWGGITHPDTPGSPVVTQDIQDTGPPQDTPDTPVVTQDIITQDSPVVTQDIITPEITVITQEIITDTILGALILDLSIENQPPKLLNKRLSTQSLMMMPTLIQLLSKILPTKRKEIN